jgi:exosortase/archaeosortase family protein
MASLAESRLTFGLDRRGLFFGAVLLASLNAFMGPAARALSDYGLAYALFELFGISAILWTALAAALALLRDAPPAPLRRGDPWVALVALLAALLPAPPASAVALTLVGLYLAATASVPAERKAGLIAVAMTGPLLWGRLLLALFSGPMLAADTRLVALVTGAQRGGNLIGSADDGHGLAVAPGCSSWQGISLALLLWVTVNQWFGVRSGPRAFGILAAAVVATVAINVLRIAAMLTFPTHIEAIHHGWGWHLAMWSTLLLVAAICLWGARREAFG